MCAEDQDNWDNYVEQVLGIYRGVPNLTTGESPFITIHHSSRLPERVPDLL